MKKSNKVLTFTALVTSVGIAGAGLAYYVTQNVQPTVYGPPDQIITEENGTTVEESTSEVSTDVENEFKPDDNIPEDIYGPPSGE